MSTAKVLFTFEGKFISAAPVVTLSNGLRIANFSSPHPFNFEDGTILEACQEDRVKAGSLDKEEEVRPWGHWDRVDIVAVTPKFVVNQKVWDLLVQLEDDKGVDIVLIPFPLLEALREKRNLSGHPLLKYLTKMGTICVKDRMTKEIFINRFCR